jgi:HSP20 family protein
MPGVDKGDVEITLENGTLTINGKIKNEETDNDLKYREFNLYNFYRSFNVGREINGDAIKATMENGVLVLALPKKEELKPRKIEVTTHRKEEC